MPSLSPKGDVPFQSCLPERLERSCLIPAKAFEHERHYLVKLPAHLPAPYRVHERETDQYGYAAFDGNLLGSCRKWLSRLNGQSVEPIGSL